MPGFKPANWYSCMGGIVMSLQSLIEQLKSDVESSKTRIAALEAGQPVAGHVVKSQAAELAGTDDLSSAVRKLQGAIWGLRDATRSLQAQTDAVAAVKNEEALLVRSLKDSSQTDNVFDGLVERKKVGRELLKRDAVRKDPNTITSWC